MKKIAIYTSLTLVLILSIALTILAVQWQFFIQRPLTIPKEGLTIDIPRGSSLQQITAQLQEKHALTKPKFFIWLAKSQEKAQHIKAGEYFLNPGITPTGLLDKMVRGDVVLYPFRIREGWTYYDLKNYMATFPKIKTTLDLKNDQMVIKALSAPENSLEGLLFPDTYYVSAHMTDRTILMKAYAHMQKILAIEWNSRAPNLPYKSPYEALIVASIIEKETADPNERYEVSGVILRRLQRDMFLQVDPTVVYGLGESFSGNLTKANLEADTPYNTYTRKGLPITPIAMPSRASIRAALHPTPGDSLYFVAKGNGTHQFSSTLDEHNKAVKQYILNRNKSND